MTELNSCGYIDWYQFKECCKIKSCKNYTEATKHKCMALDRREPIGSKIISDVEIHHYKFGGGKKVSTRLISLRRKNVVERVRRFIIIYKYVEYIKNNYSPTFITTKSIREIKKKKPFKLKKWRVEDWVWKYFFDESIFKAFTRNTDCENTSVHSILDMSKIDYDNIVNKFRKENNLGD